MSKSTAQTANAPSNDAPVPTKAAPSNDAPVPKKKPTATLQIPISLEEIQLVQGLPRAQRKLWAKRVADQIYKLVRGYQPVPAGYEPIPGSEAEGAKLEPVTKEE